LRFYAKAPWPLGDADKALAQAAEIARRDPKRGLAAYQALTALFEKAGDKQEALSAAQAAQKLAPAPAGR
jgi:tetratricopeptide (TPR) repeat protein